jgi:hypothetical protein
MINNVKKDVKLLLIVLLLTLVACSDDVGRQEDSLLDNNQIEQPGMGTELPETTEPTVLNPPDTDSEILYLELYTPIITAYAILEDGGFVFNDSRDFISDELLEIQLEWGGTVSESIMSNWRWIPYSFGWDGLPKLLYSLHDMSGGYYSDRPELLIGVESNGIIEIISIYTIERYDFINEDEPDNYGSGVRAVFGVADRNIVSTVLTTDTNGFGVIITTSYGNEGEIYEYFQRVGPGIGVGWLDMIMTVNPQQRYRACYIGPCDDCVSGYYRISEEEYIEVLEQFGFKGFDVEAAIETRHVNLEWRSVLASRQR